MKISFITLGCKTNQYESEKMAKQLANIGFMVDFGFQFADIFVLNTCSVTSEADKKSRQMIAKLNKINPNCNIIVCGCSSENNAKQFENKQNVKLVLGVKNKFDLVDYVKNNYSLSNKTNIEFRTRKYLKIQDGCNNFCTYCIIPYLRGREMSRPIEDIVFEAKMLEKTCKEIVLTGINMSHYGNDFGKTLTDLIVALKDVNLRVRIGSLEVNVINQQLIDACKNLKHFCPHFHLSLQSGCNEVLKAMNRHYDVADFTEKVNLIRDNFANPFIACDLIVGFPTETDENFINSINNCINIKFSFMHIFPYSQRKGTVACKYKPLKPEIIAKREAKANLLNSANYKSYLTNLIGCKVEVLIEQTKNGESFGLSLEYAKCYFKETYADGEIVCAKVVKLYKDGVLVEKY